MRSSTLVSPPTSPAPLSGPGELAAVSGPDTSHSRTMDMVAVWDSVSVSHSGMKKSVASAATSGLSSMGRPDDTDTDTDL